MEASTQNPPLPFRRPPPRLAAGALVLLAACGGTTGRENILAFSEPPVASIDAQSPDSDPASETIGTLEAAALSADATLDRAIPSRPPPMDTGVLAPDAATANDAATPADAGSATTLSILAAQSPDCLAFEADGGIGGCAAVNGCLDPAQQGGVCETVAGSVRMGNGVTERQLCIETLHDIFASKCAAAMSETPCLCGNVDAPECLSGAIPPAGPLYPTYVEDFGLDINTISSKFTLHTYGAGQANSIAQCLLQWECASCFGAGASRR
jgi:hypothetical protein